MKTIKFHKTECGVDFLLNVLTEKDIDYTHLGVYDTDHFEILFFKKAKGVLLLNQKEIQLNAGSIIFISPFQKRKWEFEPNDLEVTSLIFQEAFLNDFFADKLFTHRLLYFYQLVHPLKMTINTDELLKYCGLLTEIKKELLDTQTDSVHIIRSLLYYLLQTLNRQYANQHNLLLKKSENNFAFLFKSLMEIHIKEKQRIADYTEMLGISRISLNKAVKAQFNTTATQLLKQRLLFEIQNLLLHSNKTISEIAYILHFSESNHLMRFFKAQTNQTTTQFINSMNNIPLKHKPNSSDL
ncbi:AraC family transcriptional regulator [Flavobacterium sp. HSC-61S13]|uniref:helix-turn-helix domain-containing protein n=1 Tax=Flavobacterium sp. HSC-61S13 TaxID=2910963 RepID=UPI0020A003C3|nr:AraC family transcriptional regulator [Flavobacterium sp. HSC-61S13]MCP1996104.1 AraC family transcriptional activator of pobA [Flavobacterium sp. HSC-61S13]